MKFILSVIALSGLAVCTEAGFISNTFKAFKNPVATNDPVKRTSAKNVPVILPSDSMDTKKSTEDIILEQRKAAEIAQKTGTWHTIGANRKPVKPVTLISNENFRKEADGSLLMQHKGNVKNINSQLGTLQERIGQNSGTNNQQQASVKDWKSLHAATNNAWDKANSLEKAAGANNMRQTAKDAAALKNSLTRTRAVCNTRNCK